jgi:hypothetical protein
MEHFPALSLCQFLCHITFQIANGLSVTWLFKSKECQGIRIRKYGWEQKFEFTPNDNM